MNERIRVLVADDSPTVRKALVALLEDEVDLCVVGQAGDGPEAVELALRLRPDVVTMDVMMPGDGLRATEEIMASAPTRIIVVSQLAASQQDLAMRALAAGALEVLPKPATSGPEDLARWGRALATTVRLMREVPVITRRRREAPVTLGAPVQSIDALGIVASTGGPQLLATLLAGLPASLPIPILVAQHLAEGFVDGLARWLGQATPLRVEVLRAPAPALAGTVYLAPSGHSVVWQGPRGLALRRCDGALCPSGDVTLESLATGLGGRAGGLVLTGMGEDGARGLLAVRRAGGLALAQDEASCVIYGMPRAAVAMGAVMRVVTPGEIPSLLARAARRPEELP